MSDLKIDPTIVAFDSNQHVMIVGDTYEMYAPAAEMARDGGLGLLWKDNVGFSFVFDGVATLGAYQYITSKDIGYNKGKVPIEIYDSAISIAKRIGSTPFAPLEVAAQFIRPVTDE